MMNAKFLLPEIALGLSVLSLSAIVLLPEAARASSPTLKQQAPGHLAPEPMAVDLLARGEDDKLNLSADQKIKNKRIREESRDQIQRILTTDQQNQWKAAQQQGQKGREVMPSLNLSDSQKNQIRAIQKVTKERIEALLTPEQREKMRQRSRSRRST